jgi:peroxiredoxin
MTQTGEIHPRLSVGSAAPDFTLPDHNGTPFTLSAVTQTRNALLVFNIGFA